MIGIIYGAIVATMQKDLKRLVAYSSVAHLGFIVLGTFAFTSQSITGSVMQMVNHGVSTGALFLLVGMIYERRHTRQIADLKGIQSVAPIFAAAFMIVMLSSIGVPGLNGFVGEYLILIGSFLTSRWYAVIAATGVILAALYLLWAYQRVFHGEPDEDNKTFAELKLKEALVLLPFIGVIVFTGVYPKPMLERIEPAVDALIAHVEDKTDFEAPQPEPDDRGRTTRRTDDVSDVCTTVEGSASDETDGGSSRSEAAASPDHQRGGRMMIAQADLPRSGHRVDAPQPDHRARQRGAVVAGRRCPDAAVAAWPVRLCHGAHRRSRRWVGDGELERHHRRWCLDPGQGGVGVRHVRPDDHDHGVRRDAAGGAGDRRRAAAGRQGRSRGLRPVPDRRHGCAS